jgi:hypothetical protein
MAGPFRAFAINSGISSRVIHSWQMKRRSYRKLRASGANGFHHSVYVILLGPGAANDRKLLSENRHRDPAKPCVYVGMTGLTPEERFENHKRGIKSARVVQLYGTRLLPELYEAYNPMPFKAAAEMERDLAQDLRLQGYTVAGGT